MCVCNCVGVSELLKRDRDIEIDTKRERERYTSRVRAESIQTSFCIKFDLAFSVSFSCFLRLYIVMILIFTETSTAYFVVAGEQFVIVGLRFWLSFFFGAVRLRF